MEVRAQEYLVFALGRELFATGLASIREVVRPGPIARVPGARHDIRGITSIRGRLVTVVDLARSLGLGAVGSTRTERLMIAEYEDEAVGYLVDEIREVVRIPPGSIEEPAVLGTPEKVYLRGIARVGQETLVLIDVDALSPILEAPLLQLELP